MDVINLIKNISARKKSKKPSSFISERDRLDDGICDTKVEAKTQSAKNLIVG